MTLSLPVIPMDTLPVITHSSTPHQSSSLPLQSYADYALARVIELEQAADTELCF